MANREDTIRKVMALRAKTEEAGATEAEAIAAAEMASRIMTDWEIDEAEIAEREGASVDTAAASYEIGKHTITIGTQAPPAWRWCWQGLERFTRCETIRSSITGGARVHVFGDLPDRELYKFLFKLINDAVEREWAIYSKPMKGQIGRSARGSFIAGMGSRINLRLAKIAAERDREVRASASASRALVLADNKAALVSSAFKQEFPKVRMVSRRSSVGVAGAYSAGQAAGDRVGFGRPLGSGGFGGLLGRT